MDITLSSQFIVPQYQQLVAQFDEEKGAMWHYLNPRPRPCFTVNLLKEMRELQNWVVDYRNTSSEAAQRLRYLVLASATPSVFNLGGDLELFAQLIAEGDKERLRQYAHLCIDCVYNYSSHLEQPGLTTIALVQGKALGGGFEAALSCNVIVAERGTMFGFPEILFNLFPGMGAYSFLVRRINPCMAERFLRDGVQHSAETLYEMGIVDVLANRGEGVRAVCDYIRRQERARHGFQAIQQLREWNNPVTREELIRITDMWVEAAMQVGARELRTMARLTSAQHKLAETTNDFVDEPGLRTNTIASNVVQLEERKAETEERMAMAAAF